MGLIKRLSPEENEGELSQVLAQEARTAVDQGLAPFVGVHAVWAPPAQAVLTHQDHPLMVQARDGVALLIVDVDDGWDPEQYTAVGIDPRVIPVYWELDADGRSTGRRLAGDAWGDDIPENMGPVLGEFFGAAPAPISPASPKRKPAPAKRRPLIAGWIKAVAGLVVLLWVVFNIVYRLGGGGISVSGADASFDRKFDYALYKIDARWAFSLSESGDVSVVKYKAGFFPFNPVCGRCALDGRVLNLAHYKKGDWVYSQYPELDGVDAVNLKTRKTYELKVPKPPSGKRVDPVIVPLYHQHGLTFSDSLKLTPKRVADKHDGLSSINESCIVFNAVFFLLFGLLLVSALLSIVINRVRQS